MTGRVCDLTRVWLAKQVRQLWELSSDDLGRACREFDRLVAEHGRVRMARALADADLDETIRPGVAPGYPAAVATGTGADATIR